MTIRESAETSATARSLLKRCYKFVSSEWQHVPREHLPDQGFERRFRDSCVTMLADWTISYEREMNLGGQLQTASGVRHEIDLVGSSGDVTAILELKNRGYGPDKNDVALFFAKLLDYVAGNAALALKEVCPVFMSTMSFQDPGLAACLGLGVHPITPDTRPLPLLIDNARAFEFHIKQNDVPNAMVERVGDFAAKVNALSVQLSDTWFGSRCGYLGEERISLRTLAPIDSYAAARQLRVLNSESAQLVVALRALQQRAAS